MSSNDASPGDRAGAPTDDAVSRDPNAIAPGATHAPRASRPEHDITGAPQPRRVRPLSHRRPDTSISPAGARAPMPADARQWSRAIDRRVRLWRGDRAAGPAIPSSHLAEVTRASFFLDGIEVAIRAARAAVDVGSAARTLDSPNVRRLRGHVAILRRIERLSRRGRAITPGEVFRWHAALAHGLPCAVPDAASSARLTDICFRLATPHRRRAPAVEEAARLYAELLNDPLFPNFNGILARLLLSYALARTGLPPVVFDADEDLDTDSATPRRLQELIAGTLDGLIDAAPLVERRTSK